MGFFFFYITVLNFGIKVTGSIPLVINAVAVAQNTSPRLLTNDKICLLYTNRCHFNSRSLWPSDRTQTPFSAVAVETILGTWCEIPETSSFNVVVSKQQYGLPLLRDVYVYIYRAVELYFLIFYST